MSTTTNGAFDKLVDAAAQRAADVGAEASRSYTDTAGDTGTTAGTGTAAAVRNAVAAPKKHQRDGKKGKTPTVIVDKIKNGDVLFGRGTGPNENPGNKVFRRLILKYSEAYRTAATRSERRNVVKRAVEAVTRRKSRFLRKVPSSATDKASKDGPAEQKSKKAKGRITAHGPFEVVSDPSIIRQKVKLALRYAGGDDKDNDGDDDVEDDSAGVAPTVAAVGSAAGAGGGSLRSVTDRSGTQHTPRASSKTPSLAVSGPANLLGNHNGSAMKTKVQHGHNDLSLASMRQRHGVPELLSSGAVADPTDAAGSRAAQGFAVDTSGLRLPSSMLTPSQAGKPSLSVDAIARMTGRAVQGSSPSSVSDALTSMSSAELLQYLDALRRIEERRRLEEQSAITLLAQEALQQIRAERAALLEALVYKDSQLHMNSPPSQQLQQQRPQQQQCPQSMSVLGASSPSLTPSPALQLQLNAGVQHQLQASLGSSLQAHPQYASIAGASLRLPTSDHLLEALNNIRQNGMR